MQSSLNNNIVVTYNSKGQEIHFGDKVCFAGHTGVVEYDHQDCCFIIRWDDGSVRNITHPFAGCLEVMDE